MSEKSRYVVMGSNDYGKKIQKNKANHYATEIRN